MQFQDTSATTLSGLIQDCEFLCGLTDTAISSSTSLQAHFTRLINSWYYRVLTWVWDAQGTWRFDDVNKTDSPVFDLTMTASTEAVVLPTETNIATSGAVYVIDRVEVKDSGGNYIRLNQIDETELGTSLSDYEKTAGLPHSYYVRGTSIFLKPAPASGSVTLTSGLRVFGQRGLDKFTVVDSTQVPSFPEQFHRILSYGASNDYLLVNTSTPNKYRAEIEELRKDLQSYYGFRNRDKKTAIHPRKDSYY